MFVFWTYWNEDFDYQESTMHCVMGFITTAIELLALINCGKGDGNTGTWSTWRNVEDSCLLQEFCQACETRECTTQNCATSARSRIAFCDSNHTCVDFSLKNYGHDAIQFGHSNIKMSKPWSNTQGLKQFAIDGIFFWHWENGSCIHTSAKQERDPWWQVRLTPMSDSKSLIDVKWVSIVNRYGATGWLKPFVLNVWQEELGDIEQGLCYRGDNSFPLIGTVRCDPTRKGNVLRITQLNTYPLNICEVAVYDQDPGCFVDEHGFDYSGPIKTTVSGTQCLKWSSQHNKFSQYYNEDHNMCRNFPESGMDRPWCYETSSLLMPKKIPCAVGKCVNYPQKLIKTVYKPFAENIVNCGIREATLAVQTTEPVGRESTPAVQTTEPVGGEIEVPEDIAENEKVEEVDTTIRTEATTTTTDRNGVKREDDDRTRDDDKEPRVNVTEIPYANSKVTGIAWVVIAIVAPFVCIGVILFGLQKRRSCVPLHSTPETGNYEHSEKREISDYDTSYADATGLDHEHELRRVESDLLSNGITELTRVDSDLLFYDTFEA